MLYFLTLVLLCEKLNFSDGRLNALAWKVMWFGVEVMTAAIERSVG